MFLGLRRLQPFLAVFTAFALSAWLSDLWPAHAQSTPDQLLFGPKQYTRTTGAPVTVTDSFSVPPAIGPPFVLHLVNGDASGAHRVTSATVVLNGVRLLAPADFSPKVAVIDRTVSLQATNTLQVTVSEPMGGFFTISILGTKILPTPATLTPNPLTITVGATGTLTATLSPTPTTAGTLGVSSTDTGVGTVPATVSFASGQSSVPVPVTAVSMGNAMITVSLNGGSASSTVQVTPQPPTITSLTPDTLTITQGGTGMLTVTVSAAQTTDTTMSLSSTASGIAFVPASVTVPAGLTQATVTVSANTPGTAQITASLNGTNATSLVTVTPAQPTVVSLLPPANPVTLGATTTLTVTISAAQPTGTTVTVTATPSGIVSVPPSVTVPAGQTSAPITVGTQALGPALVAASLNGTTAEAAVQVLPSAPALVSLTPSPLTVVVNATGTLTVTLNETQLANTTVTLTVDQGSVLQVPASVTVPSGQTQGSFTITGLALGDATITATLNATTPTTQTALVHVIPPPPTVVALVPNPLAIQQGATSTFTLTINAAQLADTAIPLTNSAPSVLQAPSSVTVPAGQTSVTFPVIGLTLGNATVTAAITSTNVSASVQVTPPPTVVTGLTPAPVTVPKGTPAVLHVAVSPASTEPQSVSLTSSNTAVATVPPTVPVPAGALGADFPVLSVSEGSTTITATLNGGTASATVVVTPAELVTLTLSPQTPTLYVGQTQAFTATGTFTDGTTQDLTTSVTWTSSNQVVATINASGAASALAAGPTTITAAFGAISAETTLTVLTPPALSLTHATASLRVGDSLTMTVTSAAPADPGGLTVTLSQSGTGSVTMPATVVIPEGQSSATFTVTGASAGCVTLTASAPIRLPASSTLTVTNLVPVLSTLSPNAVPSGSPALALTLAGDRFAPGATVQFGTLSLAATFVSSIQLSVMVPSSALSVRGVASVTVVNPAPGGGPSNSLVFTIQNGPPRLTPIGNQAIGLGSTLSFTVTATDPDNDLVTFAVTPLPLPAHTSFNAQTGQFVFTPDADQVGTFTLTFVASDGAASSSETNTITITGAPTGGVTGVSGQVREPLGPPIPNIIVTLKGTTLSTRTDAEGRFTLTGLPPDRVGRQQLILDGFSEGDHALLVTPVDLTANVITQLPSAFTLPAVDKVHTVTVNPNVTTILSNPTIPNVAVTIAPGTAKNADGTLYSGALSISIVPEYGRPESRPAELRPGFSIAIQPAGVIMDPPAPIVFPNVDNMTPGAALDLWSLSPDTGLLYDVGKMQVSADGQSVITVSGGVRKTAWHFVLAPPGVSTMAQNPLTSGPCTSCQAGSQAELQEGALALDQVIPGIRSLGTAREITLRYRSTSADMKPILPVNATLAAGISRPQTFSVRLTVGGVQQGTELYWSAAGLPPLTQASVSRLGVPFDAAALPTGRYPFDLMLFSNYSQSSMGGGLKGLLLLRNERASAFGAGWTLQGLDRLYFQTDGTVLLASGDGETAVYGQQNRPLVVESFDLSRSGGVTVAGQYSFVAGSIYAEPRAALLDLANFGPAGIAQRPVQLRTGMSTITTGALTGVDVFVLNHWSSTPPSSSEVVALEQFVNEGGVLIELQANFPSSGRPIILGTFPGTILGDATSVITTAGLISPLVQGPFGTVLNPVTTGTTSDYPVIGAFSAVANNDRGPDILMLQQGQSFGGAGRAAFFADAEVFASNFPCCGLNLFNANRTLFLNTFAFSAGAPGFRPPPPPPGTGAIYVGPPGDFSTLARNADGTFTRMLKDGTQYQFDTQGLQTAVVDRNGNTTTYAYDGQGNLISKTDPAGQVTTFSYSGARLASITDPAGRVTQFAHDGDGNLTRITYADTSEVRFDYDPQHRLTKRTDAGGQVYQYAYDFAGRFTQATLPTGEMRRLTPTQRAAVPDLAAGEGTRDNPAPLAAPSPPASFQDGNGHTSSFTLDPLGRITQQTDALNRVTTIDRDSQGNPTKITRPNGAVTTITYDAKGNLLTTTEQAISATTTFTYEPTFNQVTSIKDPKNNTTTITYDAKGNPLTITDADNKVTTLTYDSRGLLTSTTDALNQTTTFTYDSLGRLLTTTDPLSRTTTLTYDAAGNVATSTDALNRVTSFEYDAFNRLKKVTDPTGGVTQYTYDGNGNLLSVKDAKNQTTTFTYDAKNRLASTTDPLGRVETYTYDGADNLTSRVTPKGDTISFAYDVVNQLLSKTLPGSQVTSYTYDTVGNLTGVTDPDSKLTMTYDQANRLISVATTGSSNQPSVTLTYTYDKIGNRLTLDDPAKRVAYAYDTLNRLTTLDRQTAIVPPLPPDLLAWWPAEGTAQDQVDSHNGTLQNGTTFGPGPVGLAFVFDGVDDLVTFDATIGNFGTGDFTVEFWLQTTSTRHEVILGKRDICSHTNFWSVRLWDSGRLLIELDQSGANYNFLLTTRAVNDGQAHRVMIVRQGPQVWVYLDGQLDATGATAGTTNLVNTAVLQAGFGPCVGLDGTQVFTGRLDEIAFTARAKAPSEPPPTLQLTFAGEGGTTYANDALSRRTSVTLPNGTQTSYTYDLASQVTNLLHKIVSSGTQINKADYVYNTVGDRTSLTDPRGVQSFGYDALDRLTSATHPVTFDQSFAYDPVGNRTTNGSLYNVGNQLTEDASFTYTYDANGNLTQKTFKTSGNHIDYTYDAENRLVKVEEFAFGASTPGATSTYRYDGLGRRIEKVGNGITRRYIYDGEDILLEYDGSNTLQARYTHGPGIDEPIAMTRGGQTLYYHADGRGTVTDLTDGTGAVAQSYAYDAWGNIIQQTGTVENPYTYTGREFDVETGLYYYRARQYDPRTGRFLQKDPIGIKGGPNPYAYVLGNPVKLTDPLGLFSVGVCGSNFIQRFFIFDQPGPYSFANACKNHDACYNRCEAGKTDCDDRFYLDMIGECNKLTGFWAQNCSIDAVVYYASVSKYGDNAYRNAQARCKNCK